MAGELATPAGGSPELGATVGWSGTTVRTVDVAALRDNLAGLVTLAAPAALIVDLSADAYGHGAVAVARVAQRQRIAAFTVGLLDEATTLRAEGVSQPILLLREAFTGSSKQPLTARLVAVAANTVRSARLVDSESSHLGRLAVLHATGGRAICAEQGHDADAAFCGPDVWIEPPVGVIADVFDARVMKAPLNPRGDPQLVGYITGAATYGFSRTVPPPTALRPVLELRTRVVHIQHLAAGTPISYGLRYRLPRRGTVATVPIGYADGVPRRLSETGGEVLVHGHRRPIAGAITMDLLMIDCGTLSVEVGDEVIILGAQARETISVIEWAERLDTIPDELLCRLRSRVPRRYIDTDH